jgi:23S rRNA (pseudouridine1915-N3)-methyltransferase
LKPEARDRGKTVAQCLELEAKKIQSAAQHAKRIALDERGQLWTTQKLAQNMKRWRDDAEDVAFIIGSADGLAPEIKQNASRLLSLSPLTLPHGLARLLLVEQLYRSISILNGLPYHRE